MESHGTCKKGEMESLGEARAIGFLKRRMVANGESAVSEGPVPWFLGGYRVKSFEGILV